MPFADSSFLIHNDTGRWLFEQVHALPIVDYHCHLPPADVAADRQFANLTEIWIDGDHYKWRAMRAAGVQEHYITGKASPWEKFHAYAAAMPQFLRNPLYHWSHLELRRYFGIDCLLNAETAADVWARANAVLAQPDMSAQGILRKFRVAVVGTTDDPADMLDQHQAFAAQGHPTRMVPTFRPDKAMITTDLAAWHAWLARFETAAGQPCRDLDAFLAALDARHAHFHSLGCRLSDHGLERVPHGPCSRAQAAAIFARLLASQPLDAQAQEQWGFFILSHVGRLNAQRGWTLQLHLGALRSTNTRQLRELGPDTGFDSIGDFQQGPSLVRFLDGLDGTNELPKTILYNLNPADNYLFGTMIGNFQDGTTPGKLQLGSGWWFLDQHEAMTWQINTLSNLGLLSQFVGMLTDSRSFMSYCRHEYFRRLLCNLLGAEAERGDLPNDRALLRNIVRDICFFNAAKYFGFEIAEGFKEG